MKYFAALPFALAAALQASPAAAQANMGLPTDPKTLAIACSAIVMTELFRVEEEGQTPILGLDSTKSASRAWVTRAATLTGVDAPTLLTGAIGEESEKALDLAPALFGLRLGWCVRNPPQ